MNEHIQRENTEDGRPSRKSEHSRPHGIWIVTAFLAVCVSVLLVLDRRERDSFFDHKLVQMQRDADAIQEKIDLQKRLDVLVEKVDDLQRGLEEMKKETEL